MGTEIQNMKKLKLSQKVSVLLAALFLTAGTALANHTPGHQHDHDEAESYQPTKPLPEVVRFGVGADNMPLSQQKPPSGFEVDFARALAKQMGTKAEFVWLSAHADSFEQAVADRRCDVAMGAIVEPGAMAGKRDLPGVRLTKPYYNAGYVLIRRATAPPVKTLDGLGDKRLAIEAESIVAYTLRQRGYKVHLLHEADDVIEAVAKGKENYGYLWGPLVSWQLRDRRDVVVEPEFVPVDSWQFALAVRTKNLDLWNALNRSIRTLTRDGSTARLMAAYDGSTQRAPEASARTEAALPQKGK